MKPNMTKRLATNVLAGTLAVALIGVSSIALADDNGRQEHGRNSLTGTWSVQVTFRICGPGGVPDPEGQALLTFPALNSFSRGGTASEFGVASLNLRSPGYGTWSHTGEHTFTAPITFFRFGPSVQIQPDTYEIVSTERTITMISRDEYTSLNKTTFRSPDGTVKRIGCATEVGTRM